MLELNTLEINVALKVAAQAMRAFPNTSYVLAETAAGGLHCLEWCGTPAAEL